MKKEKAIVITDGLLHSPFAKTCHGLLRGSRRYEVLAVIDAAHAGKDAGEVLDGKNLHIPVFESVEAFFLNHLTQPVYCIVGIATPGGILLQSLRNQLLIAMSYRLSIVCGLHTFLGDDPEFSKQARENGVQLIDVRKPRPSSELRFWSGEIYKVKTPIIAVLGTDCAVGKRTTCRFLQEMCRKNGIDAEMIYTGQTGWMQGYKHGFIFDSTINDFIGGEIERVLVECERESRPDLILIEGQSSLRNPTGPCGSEILLSGNVKGVILQHAPGRTFFEGTEEIGAHIPSIESEIALTRFFGAEVLAVSLNEEHQSEKEMDGHKNDLRQRLGIPVIRPLREGVEKLLPIIIDFMKKSLA